MMRYFFFRIHAVAVCDNANYFYDHVDETLEGIGMGDKVKSTEILDVVDGYKGQGYGLTTDKDLSNIFTARIFTIEYMYTQDS